MTDKFSKEEIRKLAESDLNVFAALVNPNRLYGEIHREWMVWSTHPKRKNNQLTLIPRAHQKALSIDSKVLTPSGWAKNGDLSKGDMVIGSKGKPIKILDTSPVMVGDLYRVTTRDGRSVVCNSEHLWNVYIPSNTGNKIVTKSISEIAQVYRKERWNKKKTGRCLEHRVFIPNPSAVNFSEKKLPVEPYTLGYWLGDGTTGQGNITTADPEVAEYIRQEGYHVTKHSAKYRYGIYRLQTPLKNLGILYDKKVPTIY